MRAWWSRGSALLLGPESPRPAAAMRCLLGLVLLMHAAFRHRSAAELYSTAGSVFRAFPAQTAWFPVFDANIAYGLHAVYLFVLLCVMIGCRTQLSLAFALVLTVYFNGLDVVSTLTKYSAIVVHLLFWLCWTRSDGWLAVDARSRQSAWSRPLSPRGPRLMLRFLTCAIYWGAAITKLRLPDFATGDLLEFSLLDDAYGAGGLGHWLASYHSWLVVAGYAVILFELVFPVVVWWPGLRRLAVFCAIMFHLGLWAILWLEIFSPVMLVLLLSFLHEEDWRWFRARLPWLDQLPADPRGDAVGDTSASRPMSGDGIRRMTVRFSTLRRIRPWAAWTGGIVSAGMLGAVLTPATPLATADSSTAFQEEYPSLRDADVDKILSSYKPPYAAYLHRLEAGQRAGYRRVFGEAHELIHGQTLHVLTRWLVPHPELELRWEILPVAREATDREAAEPAESNDAPGNHVVISPTPATEIAGRLNVHDAYASIGLTLGTDFPAGRYRLRLWAREPRQVWELLAVHGFDLRSAD